MTLRKQGNTFTYVNKQAVHDRKPKPRKYRGEAEADDLLNWLNAKNPSTIRMHAKAEMERGIELIQFTHNLQPGPAHRESSPELRRAQRELNEWLLRYTYSHRLDFEESGPVWSLRVNADVPRVPVRGEAEAVDCAVKLAKIGVISQINKCACGAHFFVRFPKRKPPERFCSDQCRVNVWESSQERKEQKREWARKNYQSRKELELGSRRAAQRKQGGR